MATLEAERSHSPPRQPAVLVAVCFAAGIVLDRFVLTWTWGHWFLASFLALAFAVYAARSGQSKLLVTSLLAGGICLGGLRHHSFWSLSNMKDVARFATLESRLVKLKGVVTEPPYVKLPSAAPFRSVLPQSPTTIFPLKCESLWDRDRFISVNGNVQARIIGLLSDLQVGDAIEITGWITLPSPPANPGDFDYGDYLKQHQITCVVRVQQPEAVILLAERNGFDWNRFVDFLRRRAEGVFQRHLSEENANIASALLLGSRSTLPEDLLTAFAETGMMHVLALSGMHVIILAALVWSICRLLQLSPRTATWLTLAAVLALAVISGGRPPIVRAVVFLVIVSLGQLANRQSHPVNILALSALVILAWNPSNLFDVGAQLSFLAVIGILIGMSWSRSRFDSETLAPDESQMEDRFRQAVLISWRFLRAYLAMTTGIWLLTAPLIAARFQLISPIGMLLNLFLVPLADLLLWLGYCFLAIGTVTPILGSLFAVPVEIGLSLLIWTVKRGAGVWLGHVNVAGPSEWWLIGYYSLLALLYVLRPRISRPAFAGSVLILSWTILGLLVAAWPSAPKSLRCTFLSVGHGSAVLVEFPNGKTLLFDAGALDDGERAFRVVRTALWKRGISRLDAVALSHSDLDHVNGLPMIADEITVGTVFVAKSFFQSPQQVVPYLVKKLKEADIPIRTIGQEDTLEFDPLVLVQVQHPDPRKSYTHINANSLALRFTYGGRSLLLVGDVERDGLMDLMLHDSGQVDVLQAPHHGSRTANTPELARWANPSIVVACTGDFPGRTQELKSLYGTSARFLSTHDHGAVTVEITGDGELMVNQHLKNEKGGLP